MREITGFTRPFAVNQTHEGNILVGDFGSHEVSVFDPEFKRISKLAAPFRGPHSIAIDSCGYIFVCDYVAKKVFKFYPGGTFIRTILDRENCKNHPFILSGPAQMQIDPDGNLIVSDYGSSSLQKFNSDGAYLGWLGRRTDGTFSKWEDRGSPMPSKEPGGFDRVHSVAWDTSKKMWVVDTWNHRIQIFDVDGSYLGLLEGKFDTPVSIDFSVDQFVISENGTSTVQCFSENGKFLWKWGGYNHPYDLKLKGKTLLVADADNRRVTMEEV